MFNKLKVIALDVAIKELEELLKYYNATIKTNEYFKVNSTHEKDIAIGIRTAVDVCCDVRKKYIKR